MMIPCSLLLITLCLYTSVLSHEQTQHPFLSETNASSGRPLRVAIQGAGAAGTSAAYFLQFLSQQFPSVAFETTIYEKEDYVGGRSTTVPLPFAEEDAYAELGASIFVPENKNLNHAAARFGLELQDGHGHLDQEGSMAIWDGQRFLYEDSHWVWGYWDTAKILWKVSPSLVLTKTC